MSVVVEHRRCKSCAALSIRANTGTYTKKTSKRWVGEDGKQWNGLLCPQCQRNRSRVNMRRLRAERKDNESPNET